MKLFNKGLVDTIISGVWIIYFLSVTWTLQPSRIQNAKLKDKFFQTLEVCYKQWCWYKIVPKWRFVLEIRGSQNLLGGGSQDRSLEPWDQVVKVGEGWVDLESVLLTDCSVAKWLNNLQDNQKSKSAFRVENSAQTTFGISTLSIGQFYQISPDLQNDIWLGPQ